MQSRKYTIISMDLPFKTGCPFEEQIQQEREERKAFGLRSLFEEGKGVKKKKGWEHLVIEYISWRCLGEEFDNNLDLSYHNHNDISC